MVVGLTRTLRDRTSPFRHGQGGTYPGSNCSFRDDTAVVLGQYQGSYLASLANCHFLTALAYCSLHCLFSALHDFSRDFHSISVLLCSSFDNFHCSAACFNSRCSYRYLTMYSTNLLLVRTHGSPSLISCPFFSFDFFSFISAVAT